jgi:hypothetical protein
MNEKYTKELKESFPDFFKSEEDDKHQFLKYGFQHGDGWFQLVKGLMRCIYNYCENNNKPVPKILQVKEKYGTLRFYIDGGDETIRGMIWFAESFSAHTCEKCGTTHEAKQRINFQVLCPECEILVERV